MISWVHPGLELVFTRPFRLTRVLIKEDFPTLDLPAKAISGSPCSGYWEGFAALFINSADCIFMEASPIVFVYESLYNLLNYFHCSQSCKRELFADDFLESVND